MKCFSFFLSLIYLGLIVLMLRLTVNTKYIGLKGTVDPTVTKRRNIHLNNTVKHYEQITGNQRGGSRLNSWIGSFSRVFSVESTSTPPPLDASGCRWCLCSGCWSSWWLQNTSGATTRETSTATLANQVAPTSATTTSSPFPTSACGLFSSSSSLALP